MSSSTRPRGEVAGVFEEALQSFLDNIPPTERQNFQDFQDAQSMITSIESIAKAHPVHRGRLTSACRKFESLVQRIRPYFDVVDIFVQVKPECMALIWGSMKMVFKLSSNYVSFLEKMADMFEEITAVLPAYEEFLTILQERAAKRGYSHTRLAKALSLVYVDILRFMHSIYMLFSNQKRSLKVKLSFIGRLVWQPFDMQYSSLLSRLKQHSKLFELEVSLASTEEIVRALSKYEEDLKNHERQSRQPDEDNNKEQARLIDRAQRLQTWVDPPHWAERLERAQNLRAPGTGSWILDCDVYKNWRKVNQGHGGSLASRTLSIQAKPGYGKTILCSTLIEDLGAYTLDADSTSVHRGQSAVFYFFDKRQNVANTPSHAVRAMLAQLIHLHRYNQQAIDVASFLFTRSETGEFTATTNEIFAVFEVLLDQLKFTYLIFDGLDECSDPPELFQRVEEIAAASRTSAVLFLGRPSVPLPARLARGCFQIQLEPGQQQHASDMRKFLIPRLENLIDEELIPVDLDLEDTTNRITERANGMFLWTRLLIEYLRLPSLTIQDRMDAIADLNRLEGLDSIYEAILSTLASQFPGASLKNVCRLFQLVAHSHRPLELIELHHAISIPSDRAQTKLDLIPNFKKSLGSMSGSLIELSEEEKAQFIHLSAQEYFVQTSAKPQGDSPLRKVLASQEVANRNIAASCISYILHTVPAEPLGGSSQTIPHSDFVSRKYPFLMYSVEYWGAHFIDGIKSIHPETEPATSGDPSWIQLVQTIKTFLDDRKGITQWIEASYLFHRRPRAPELPEPNLIGDVDRESSSILQRLGKDLEELSHDLEILDQSWGYILMNEPNEIWEPSVSAFTKSRYWVSSSSARVEVVPASQSGSERFIVVRSQLSRDGKEMGVLKLFPIKSWMELSLPPPPPGDVPEPLGEDSGPEHWRARYELWSLVSNTVVKAVEILLEDGSMEPFVLGPHYEFDAKEEEDDEDASSEDALSSRHQRGIGSQNSDDEIRVAPPVRNHQRVVRKGEEEAGKDNVSEDLPSEVDPDQSSMDSPLSGISNDEGLEEMIADNTEQNHDASEARDASSDEDKNNITVRRRRLSLPSLPSRSNLLREFDVRKSKPCRRKRPTHVTGIVSLPHDISINLQRILVLDTVVDIKAAQSNRETAREQDGNADFHTQTLSFTDQDTGETAKRKGSFNIEDFKDFYDIRFSPSDEYFALIRKSVWWAQKGLSRYGAMWKMQIFRDDNHRENATRGPNYVLIAAIKLFAVPEVGLLSPLRGIAFHPTAPRLAFPQVLDGLPQTYIWDFEAPLNAHEEAHEKLNPFPVHEPPIIDPSFSEDGKYLFGTDAPLEFGAGYISSTNVIDSGKPLIVQVPEYVKARASPFKGKANEVSRMQTNPGQHLVSLRTAALELAEKAKPPVQRANVLSFDKDSGGVAHISKLHQLEKEGAVVLNTLGTNGKFQTETLSRLPGEVTHCVDVSIVHPSAGMDQNTVRIVLDKAPLKKYTIKDLNDSVLPAIVERQKSSIPKFVTTVNLGLGSSGPAKKSVLPKSANCGTSLLSFDTPGSSFAHRFGGGSSRNREDLRRSEQ